MAIVDVNTGRPASNTVQQNQNIGSTQVTGPQSSQTVTSGVQAQSSNQVTNSSSYAMNTTPTILNALENFITQMSDRPAISNSQLESDYPLVVPKIVAGTSGSVFAGGSGQFGVSGGVSYINPVTGLNMSEEESRAFNAKQMAKREQVRQASGVIKGGTEQQRAVSDARLQEIQRNRETQGKYTKEAAQADAQNLSGYFSRILTEQQMPGILRGAEGSGTSKGTTRSLLTQQAIARTAEVAAKTGLDASAQYGQINNQLAGTLELLTRQDPNSTENQLLQALGIGKGIVQAQSGSQSQSGNQVTKTNQVQDQTKSAEVINKVQQELPITNTGGFAPYTGASADTYTPSSMAGTMYVQKDPYSDATFGNDIGGTDEAYATGDSNITF
jgi:hypothetical protein